MGDLSNHPYGQYASQFIDLANKMLQDQQADAAQSTQLALPVGEQDGMGDVATLDKTAEESIDKYEKIRYHKDGRIVVTDDWTHKEHVRILPVYHPHAVVDTISRHGKQRDRTIYGADAVMKTQIHGGDHGQPKAHPFGKHGEHAHDYTWVPGKRKPVRQTREVTPEERIQHKDILEGEAND